MRHWLVCALCAMLAGPVLALDAAEMFDDPAREARAREIGRQLRCLVCQNESIFDSNAGLARDLRVLVRERMAAGDSDAQVIDYIAARYGDYVLLRPRLRGATYALWLAPLALLLAGGGAMLFYYRRRAAQTDAAPALTEAERARARNLLKGE